MSVESKNSPLTETVYYILLALCSPLHGYGVMQKVSQMSRGRIEMGAGTLYGALNTLLSKYWIEPFSTEVKSRKKIYKITDNGISVLNIELKRLDELIINGQSVLKEKMR